MKNFNSLIRESNNNAAGYGNNTATTRQRHGNETQWKRLCLTILALLSLSIGQMWGWEFSGDNFIYFQNKGSWNDSGKMLFIGKDSYTTVYTMSAVTGHTSLWVVKLTNAGWSDASYMAVAGGGSVWGSGNWGPSNRTNATHYTNTYTSGVDASNNQRYILTPASNSNNAALSLTYLKSDEPNYTITVKAKVSTDGGSTFNEKTSPATLSASSKRFTAFNSCNQSTSLSSGTITCGYLYSTTLTAPSTDPTGFTWVGWYNSSGTQQTTSKTLTITPTADATYYAYYTEKRYSVTVSNDGNGTVSPTGGTVNVCQVSGTQLTATPNTNYAFVDWTISGGGITPTTSTTSPQTFTATTTGGTIRANFAPQWTLKGGDSDDTGNSSSDAMGNWETFNNFALTSGTTMKCTLALAAKTTYSFKVYDRRNDKWYGNTSAFVGQTSSLTMATGKGDCHITTAKAGNYIFTFNNSSKTLTVTYPTESHPSVNYIYFKNTASWSPVYAHMWNATHTADAYPGPALPTFTFNEGTYYYAAIGSETTVIFGNNNDSRKTGDLANADTHTRQYYEYSSSSWKDFTVAISYRDVGDTEFSGTHEVGYPTIHTYGSSTTLDSPTKDNYTFDGWFSYSSGSGSAVTSIGAVAKSADFTLYAKWSEITHEVRAHYGTGGSAVTPSSWTAFGVVTGGAVSATNATGYHFNGWTIDGGAGGSFTDASSASTTFFPVTDDTWITAHFAANTYNITLDKNSGDSDGSVTATYNSGTLTSFSAAARAGYSCDGYFDDPDDGEGNMIIDASGNLQSNKTGYTDASGNWTKTTTPTTLYAHWTENATYYTLHFAKGTSSTAYIFSVSAEKTSDGSTINDNASIVSGTGVTVTATPNDHYKIVGWYSEAGCAANTLVSTDNPYSFTMDDDINLYAKAELMTTAITLNANGGAGGTSSVTATHGSKDLSSSITKPTRTGYTLAGWYTAESGGTKVINSTGYTAGSVSGYTTSDGTWIYTESTLTLYAHWTEQKKTLTPTVNYNGGATPSPAYTATSANTVGVATTTVLTASEPNAAHYTFAGWTLTNLTVTSGNAATDRSITVKITDYSQSIAAVANYNEVLTQSTWVLKGGTNVTGDNWASEHAMNKKPGASTSDVVYYVANISSTNAGNDGSNAYSFKIIKKGGSDTWYGLGSGDGEWWYSRTSGQQTMTTSSKNVQICADVAGDYEIKVDYSTPASPKVTVTFPPSLSFSATSVYSGNASTLTASVGNIVSGKTLKYDVYAGATAEGEPVATYSTTTTATTDSHAFTITPTFGASDISKQYTVKITYNGTQTATYTNVIGRKWDIKVNNNCHWPNGVYYYAFNNGENAAWPGVQCTADCGSWYTVTLDGKYPNFILGNGYKDCAKEQTGNLTTSISSYASGSTKKFTFASEVDDGCGGKNKTYTFGNASLSAPTVTLTTYDVISTTQIYVEGTITNYGGAGSAASDMCELGFKIGETKYTTTCTDGDVFKRYITGLTANSSYSVKAYVTSPHSTVESAATAHTTRATGTYTIKVRSGVSDPAPYIRAFTYSDPGCGGSGLIENASGNGVAMTPAITGTVYKWYTYSLSNEYQKFYINENASSTETWDQTAPLEETCYWYHHGAAKDDRFGTMSCPYTTPQLMINTVAAPESFTYYEMSGSGTISKTLNLAAAGTYQFKIVYNSEWYGSTSTIARTGSTTSNSLNDLAVATENNIQLTADYAGNYTFSYNTSNNTLTVTYPTAYTITYGVGMNEGSNTDISVSPSFTSGAYVLPETDVTFSKGSTKDGYTWKGWYSDVDGTTGLYSSTDANLTLTATRNSNISVYACYNKTSYTITYNLNGGTQQVDPVPATTYTVTDAVTLPTPTKSGYVFGGWYTDEELTTPAANITAGTTGNKEYWARWLEDATYTVYFYNKDKWDTPKAYLWNGGRHKTAWPGDAMTYHQDQVYKLDYDRAQDYNKIQFNDGTDSHKYDNLDLPPYNGMFYNPEGAGEWTRDIMVAAFPTQTIAAVLGEKVTVEPVVAWAEGISFAEDITITSVRTDAADDATINATVAGTKIMVSGTAPGTATFRVTYSCHSTTIEKTLNIEIKNGVTIQAKIAKTDAKWTNTAQVRMHYWGTSIGNSNLTMTWMNADADYNYYQASVPFGSDNKVNFLFYYDYMKDDDSNRWRQTADILNVTAPTCYTIGYEGHDNVNSTCTGEAGVCANSWQLQIIMGSGEIYTSNIVSSSDEIVSFFAPSNANESLSYRRGTVTLELNGSTVETYPANTFSASGVYTAKINTSTHALTDLRLYDGDYYIRTDGAAGGWNDYKTNPANKMVYFTRNTNFPNESFSYYWVANVGHGFTQNIKATVANDYNSVLCNFSPDETANEYDGINLRFGYEPTTNDLVRGIVGGSTTNNYLNLVSPSGSQIYMDIDCTIPLDDTHYSETPLDSKFADKSNWVYEIIVYAKIDDDHEIANVILKSYYHGVHHLLGMVKDNYGRETNNPVQFPVIKTGTSKDTYGLRVVYDFKTNRLFGAWAPADRLINGILNVDADVMFIRHEDGDAAQISFKTDESKIEDVKQAIFALELDNEKADHGGDGNIERHYFISLPFDCQVSNIFGLNGFMNYWGIQRYRGDLRAQKGWFKETSTFWEWLDEDDVMHAGEGYLLSVDKKALEDDHVWKDGIIYQKQEVLIDEETGLPVKTKDGERDSLVWKTYDNGSMITMYFPSTTSGFEISPATGAELTITYPNQECTITREDRNHKDSNWKCIGTPGYKNIGVNSYSATSGVPYDFDETTGNENTPPKFLYIFTEQNTGARWAKGTYNVTDGSVFTYKSFNSYMVQYAGTINWAQYSKGDAVTPSSVAARRAQSEVAKLTRTQIDLLYEEESLDRTFVWLQDKATHGFDQNFDLNKLVESKANQIYSIALTDIPFAANVLPLETDTVPLVVNIVNAGEYTFALDKDKHMGQAPILYDMFAGEQTNLLSADYTVELEKGKYEGRFYLLFLPEMPVVTNFETTVDGGQKVHSDEAIYDVLGRRVNTIYPGHLYIVNGEKTIAK